VVNNTEQFKRNSAVHSTIIRQSVDLHLPSRTLSLYQRETYSVGIKVFNHLSLQIKETAHDVEHFKKNLKGFLYSNPFYTLDEYFIYNDN
jgi:biopolymer transport protein ExbD